LGVRPSGAVLRRVSAIFAHPNAYPSTKYGSFSAGQLSSNTLFTLRYQFFVEEQVPILEVDLTHDSRL
jgi:hypothetical protein